ncbi:MAG: amylo-alpha-1,6-glucosidase [Acidobacteriota bacterium]|nr:amylo-alpha-1,6-glucosidase [Blastocatellia bacterium]MDW8240988.1 amylo-alpha-1,6-glucosidase [Acidobacteriota bacterium]
MIHLDEEICTDLRASSTREWLETNGLGGFASSTIINLHTRRYHGMLIAATQPPVGRMVLVSKLEDTLIINGWRFELSTNQYHPGVIYPEGYHYLKQFRLDPFPVFTYVVDGIELEKSVFMVHGHNTTVVQYRLRRTERLTEADSSRMPPVFLEVRPLLACRDYHSTIRQNSALNPYVQTEPGLAIMTPYAGLPTLYIAHDAETIEATGYWYRAFQYRVDRERGFQDDEDLYNPFVLSFDMTHRAEAAIIVSTERVAANQAEAYRQAEIDRRRALVAAAPFDDELVRTLVAAADQFIVARGDGHTVIAGYHWFTDWGRDTMIALPGLTLVTGRADIAKNILLEFARYVDHGMLPNRFPDSGGAPEYNSVDAALWFFQAVHAWLKYTNDREFVKTTLYPVLTEIIAWHERGTRYQIRVDADGLLSLNDPTVQLTWMDAKVGDFVVTPRHGKPVEIQALWYNALRMMEHLAHEFGDIEAAIKYEAMANRAKKSFNQLFWNAEAGCLYDVVDGERRDASIRPNQLLAVSLPYSMLSREKSKAVVKVVERELLTPYGLRSLAISDPAYRGRYEGESHHRDLAYHRGTVWAWLMGPFVTAYVKAHRRTKRSRQWGARFFNGFRWHLYEAGVGQISEIFDGNAPHTPRGCIAQAWSVGELLRAIVEDVGKLILVKRARKRATPKPKARAAAHSAASSKAKSSKPAARAAAQSAATSKTKSSVNRSRARGVQVASDDAGEMRRIEHGRKPVPHSQGNRP